MQPQQNLLSATPTASKAGATGKRVLMKTMLILQEKKPLQAEPWTTAWDQSRREWCLPGTPFIAPLPSYTLPLFHSLFTCLLVLVFCNLHCNFLLHSFFGSSSVDNFKNSCNIVPFICSEILLLAPLKKMKASSKLAYTVLTWRLRGQILCKERIITI